ncbi:MAG: hypothetical protein AAFP79_09850 [Pseudomonadota bacterium]
MTKRFSAPSPREAYARILTTLETQLTALDDAGAHKAAAHLDAAIQQLHRDQAVLKTTTIGREPEPDSEEKAAILAAFSASLPQTLRADHVVTRKAKPANSR